MENVLTEGDRRFCENCGTEIRQTTNFCPNCGAAQRPDPEVPTGPPPLTPEPGRISTPTVSDVPPPPPQKPQRSVLRTIGGVVVILVLLIVLVELCGGGRENSKGGSSTNSGSDAKEEAEKEEPANKKEKNKQSAAPAEEPAPINLSGNGQMATNPFELESGLAIFTMTHQGQRNFIVGLIDSSGKDVNPVVANSIGPSDVSKAVNIPKKDDHLLNVNADGPWTIKVEQPRPSSAPATTSFDGSGDAATSLFELSSGLHTINMSHHGERNFIVALLDKNGKAVDPVVGNEIGVANPSKAVRVPKEDIYLLNVTADGPWTIEIE